MKTADIILRDAVVYGAAGSADAVAVSGGLISALGQSAELMRLRGDGTQIIDCGGRAIVPGIVDPHCHLFAAAATLNGVNCRPAAVRDVPAVIAALRTAAVPGNGWVRGYGYDDSPLGLGRHLNRHDLDAVTTQRPVRVEHRSGHACVLNSAALTMMGIARATPDPPGGIIVRDAAGEPTGLLLEMGEWLRKRTDPRPVSDPTVLRQLSQRLLAYGITAATDAGHDNGLERWQSFAEAIAGDVLPMRVAMMVGFGHIDEMLRAGLGYGATRCDGLLNIGPVKVMLTASGGTLHPHPAELAEMVKTAHGLGFPVAIHAVERDAVVAAALTLAETPSLQTAGDVIVRDRIEHCAECPPDVLDLVAESGAAVTVNTGFLHYDGERYRRTVAADLLPHLYPAGSLLARGAPTALASDAPVVEPNPWAAMAAAVTRRSAAGAALGGVGVPSVAAALAMHTGGRHIGPGAPADLAVVEPDPLAVPLEALPSVRAVVTIVRGRAAILPGARLT